MKKWLRSAAAMLLAAVLFFSSTVFVSAEADEDDDFDYYDAYGEEEPDYSLLEEDAAIAHWSAVMVAEMQVKAFKEAEDEGDYIRRLELLDMANVYTLDPLRYLSVDITEEQAEILKASLGIENMSEAAMALGNMLNSDYENYAEAAYAVFSSKELYEDYLTDEFGNEPIGPFVAFFTYNREYNGYDDSQIVVITGDESTIGASFVISSKESALTMDESFVVEYSALLGISDPEIRLYYGDELQWMMGWGDAEDMYSDFYADWSTKYCDAANEFVSAAGDSPEFMKLLFEQLRKGIGSPSFCGDIAGAYMSDGDPEKAAFVSGELLSQVRRKEGTGDVLYDYLSYSSPVSLKLFEENEIPEIISSESWEEIGAELIKFPEDAKVLILFRRYAEDVFDQMGIDWLLQAALPYNNMAESVEDADYIVYCDVTYDGDSYTQGNLQLIYPYNHITVHDAKSGETVKDLDTIVRRLSGYTTVTSNVTYWYPLRHPVWNKIAGLFTVPEEPEDESGYAEEDPEEDFEEDFEEEDDLPEEEEVPEEDVPEEGELPEEEDGTEAETAEDLLEEEDTETAEEDAEAAEEEKTAQQILEEDISLEHWCAAMTMKMQANAYRLAAEEEENSLRQRYLLDMASVYTFDPLRFLVIDLTEEQAAVLTESFSVKSIADAAPALGDFLNLDYEDYAAAAHDITVTKTLYDNELTDECGRTVRGAYVAFLTYSRDMGDHTGSHIVVFTGDDEGIGASYVISSKASAEEMDESFIAEYADMLGLSDYDVRLYVGTEPTWMMGWSDEDPMDPQIDPAWDQPSYSSSGDVIDVLEISPEMLKLVYEQKEQGIGSWFFCAKGASEYMYGMTGFSSCAFVSGELLEKLRWEDYGTDFLTKYLGNYYAVSIDYYDEDEQPAIIGSGNWDTVGEEISAIPEDAKVLIVFRRYAEDEFDKSGIDWILQSAVPARNMPASPEEADYIIYCDVTYDGDKYTQGNLELIYPYNHITVHDAETGEIVKDLGTTVRRLSGFTTVSSNITYWAPLRWATWEKLQVLFPAPEAAEEAE